MNTDKSTRGKFINHHHKILYQEKILVWRSITAVSLPFVGLNSVKRCLTSCLGNPKHHQSITTAALEQQISNMTAQVSLPIQK